MCPVPCIIGFVTASKSRKQVSVLSQFLARLNAREEIELLPHQIDQIDTEVQRRTKPLQEQRQRISDDYRFGRVAGDVLDKEIRRLWLLAEKEELAAYKRHLLPHQWKALMRLVTQRAVLQRGLLPSLTNGRLGDDLKITDEQRSRIRKIADEHLTKFLPLSRELETFVWAEVRQAMSPEEWSRLSRLVGKPPARMAGSPTLIVMTFAQQIQVLQRMTGAKQAVDRMVAEIRALQAGESATKAKQ